MSIPEKEPEPKLLPQEWQDKLGVPAPIHCLAMAMVWHAGLVVGDGVLPDDCVADPHGKYARPIDQAAYDAMTKAARDLLAELRKEHARAVEVLIHPGLDHAVVVRMPSAAEARSMLTASAKPPAGLDAEAVTEGQLSERMLWPRPLSREKGDLMEKLPLSWKLVYPQALYDTMGWPAARVKTRA